MHGYRDHCMRTAYSNTSFYCPYSQEYFPCPYHEYRQKTEEYPAQYIKAPDTPPPSIIPNMPTHTAAGSVNSRAILTCANKFTYLWQKNGESYWCYITFIGPRSLSGWRYRNGRWIQFGLGLNQIKSFSCA